MCVYTITRDFSSCATVFVYMPLEDVFHRRRRYYITIIVVGEGRGKNTCIRVHTTSGGLVVYRVNANGTSVSLFKKKKNVRKRFINEPSTMHGACCIYTYDITLPKKNPPIFDSLTFCSLENGKKIKVSRESIPFVLRIVYARIVGLFFN